MATYQPLPASQRKSLRQGERFDRLGLLVSAVLLVVVLLLLAQALVAAAFYPRLSSALAWADPVIVVGAPISIVLVALFKIRLSRDHS